MKRKLHTQSKSYVNIWEVHDIEWKHEKDSYPKLWEEVELRKDLIDLQRKIQAEREKGAPP